MKYSTSLHRNQRSCMRFVIRQRKENVIKDFSSLKIPHNSLDWRLINRIIVDFHPTRLLYHIVVQKSNSKTVYVKKCLIENSFVLINSQSIFVGKMVFSAEVVTEYQLPSINCTHILIRSLFSVCARVLRRSNSSVSFKVSLLSWFAVFVSIFKKKITTKGKTITSYAYLLNACRSEPLISPRYLSLL